MRYVANTTGAAGETLTLLSGGRSVGQLTMAGNYTGQVFHAHAAPLSGQTEITVTNVGAALSPLHFIGIPASDTFYADQAGETLTGGAGADTLNANSYATIISDTVAGLNGDTIGWLNGCKIDLTDMLPANVTLASTINTASTPTNTLTAKNASQTAVMTLTNFGSPLTANLFHVAADGHGGTAITYG